MACPYLKEVVMLFCGAYPVKKMVPLDKLASAGPCLGGDPGQCPIFAELMARQKAAAGETIARTPALGAEKELSP